MSLLSDCCIQDWICCRTDNNYSQWYSLPGKSVKCFLKQHNCIFKNIRELQRNLPVLILVQFSLAVRIAKCLPKARSLEQEVGWSCLLHQSTQPVINWDMLSARAEESVGSKTANQFWDAGKRCGTGQSVPPHAIPQPNQDKS